MSLFFIAIEALPLHFADGSVARPGTRFLFGASIILDGQSLAQQQFVEVHVNEQIGRAHV